MTTYNIYFSPTGGTQKAAAILAANIDPICRPIDLIQHPTALGGLTLTQDDTCLIAVPVYGGRVPGTVIDMLQQINGNRARAILIAVYGNRHIDDALIELYDTLTDRNFRCIAAVEAIAEHSLMHRFATGRPDAQDRTVLTDFARQIKAALTDTTPNATLTVPGRRPYKAYGGVPIKPSAGSQCTACGRCARECPVHAIPAQDPRTTYAAVCISCMHCVAICPHNARRTGKLLTTIAAAKMRKACTARKENRLYLAE